jgi:hypothetical protein
VLSRRRLNWGSIVGALLVVGVFLAVVFSYACTEYQLTRFQAWHRVTSGRGFPLLILLGANAASFAIMWACAVILVLVSGAQVYGEATVVCAVVQGLWLTQHLWSYHRNRPRLRYEN